MPLKNILPSELRQKLYLAISAGNRDHPSQPAKAKELEQALPMNLGTCHADPWAGARFIAYESARFV